MVAYLAICMTNFGMYVRVLIKAFGSEQGVWHT